MKTASSQAAWALLNEGVSQARLDAHRIQHLMTRCLKLVEASKEKDHIYQVAGDIIMGLPKRLDHLEMVLDRTSLALAKMGETFLESRLPISEKALVDEAITSAFGGSSKRGSMETRISQRYLKKVLSQK